MSKDHFVSVTFLNNFVDDAQINVKPREKLIFCFNKCLDEFLPNRSKLENIAYQCDLDGSGDFRDKLRKHENSWTEWFNELISNNFTDNTYKNILSYLVLMSLNNPTQQEQRIKNVLIGATPEESEQLISSGNSDAQYMHMQVRDILVDYELPYGELPLNYDELLRDRLLLLPYRIVKNQSSVPFVTSDNPIMKLDDYLFIPLSRQYALQISTTSSVQTEELQHQTRNQGLHKLSKESDIREINRLMKVNAKRFVYTSSIDIF